MAKRQEDGITTLLGLKGYKVGKVTEGKETVMAEAEIEGELMCPFCSSPRLYRHGICQPKEVLHTWINGKRVYLRLHRQRFRCLYCRHTFTRERS